MTDGVNETLALWSPTQIFQTLQHTLSKRHHNSSTVEDLARFHRAQNLLYHASLRPDIASRVLLCALFLDSGFSALRAEDGAIVAYLHKMCEHAKQIEESFNMHHRETQDGSDVGYSEASAASQNLELPQDEVTFVATFMEPYLSGAIPFLEKSLQYALGSSPSSAIGELAKKGILPLLDEFFPRILQTPDRGSESGLNQTAERKPDSVGSPSVSASRKLGFSALSQHAERSRPTRPNLISLSTRPSASARTPHATSGDTYLISHTSLIDLLFGSDSHSTEMLSTPQFQKSNVRRWMSHTVKDATSDSSREYLPFRTRPRNEVRRQAMADEAHTNSTTVILREGITIPAPEWATFGVESNQVEKTTAPLQRPLSASVASCEGEEQDMQEDGSKANAQPQPQPQDSTVTTADAVKKQNSNTTWIEDGQLVMIGGRLVIQSANPLKKKGEKNWDVNKNNAKDSEESKSKCQRKEIGKIRFEELNDCFSSKSESSASPDSYSKNSDSKVSNTKKSTRERDTEEQVSRRKLARGEGIQNKLTNVSSTAKRKKKKHISTNTPSQSGSASTLRVVPTHNAPLLPREEIVKLVEGWQISKTLREAFLVGLEAIESEVPYESPKISLKINNPTDNK